MGLVEYYVLRDGLCKGKYVVGINYAYGCDGSGRCKGRGLDISGCIAREEIGEKVCDWLGGW